VNDLSKTPPLSWPGSTVSIDDLIDQAERSRQVLFRVRGDMLAPEAKKVAPVFSGAQVARLCGIDMSQFNYRVSKGDLPAGVVRSTRRGREFTLPEARAWGKSYFAPRQRPPGASACTITVANFKGGVTKTSTAINLAQGLSLRGHRVLCIDLDPQGSLTTLFGFLPGVEIAEEETVGALCHGEQTSIEYAIRPTYWDGVDLVPATSALFAAEFVLPARQLKEKGFPFWDVLNRALVKARQDYDIIVIDTPPALSYLTSNALVAADGIIVPMPSNALVFASSAQFWDLFSDLFASLRDSHGLKKAFAFIHVLLVNKADANDVAAAAVRKWILAAYSDKVLPVEMPATRVANTSAAEFGSIYDIVRYEGSAKTYQRAREAYDRLVELIEESVLGMWHNPAPKGEG